jgi:hypothetical protein
MKKAVILANHFRSFEYITGYLKEFFGDNTDYYICTWDHEYNYSSRNNSRRLGFEHKLKADLTLDLYEPIDTGKVENTIKNFNPKNYKILSDSIFEEWVKSIYTTQSDPQIIKSLLASFYPPKVCIDMIKESGIKYDIVFKSRMDIIPILTQGMTLEEICKEVHHARSHKLYNNLIKIKHGLPWMNDRFFYGHPDVLFGLYNDMEYRISKINSIDFLPISFIPDHFLYGMLLMFTGTTVHQGKIHDEIIRKGFVDLNYELGNPEHHRRYINWERQVDRKKDRGEQ